MMLVVVFGFDQLLWMCEALPKFESYSTFVLVLSPIHEALHRKHEL